MLQKTRYDVVVVGGGPGGSAAAAVAARGGLDVLLVERQRSPSFKIGESLMPETYWSFEKMGALDAIRSAGFVKKHSVQFYSSGGKASAPFYFDSLNDHESAQTWQVHRADFDELLIDNARRQGAECVRGARVRELVWDGERAVGARVESANEVQEVEAQAIIDATGQSRLVARGRSLPRLGYQMDHASIFTHFQGALRDQGRDEGATLILQTRDGDSWFWFIPLARDIASIGVVGKVEQLIKNRDTAPHETFYDEVARCPEIERRIEGALQVRPIQTIRDFSYRNEQLAGDGWVLVGDAYSFIDPVYSSGIFLALKSGELAAEAVIEGVGKGDCSAAQLGSFQPQLRQGMQPVLRLVRAFYAPNFSFGGFLREYPQHQVGVTKILVGDVFTTDFGELFEAMDAFQERVAVAV